jgi:hypothetical protein
MAWRFSLSLKECIAKVSGAAVTAYLLSDNPTIAPMIGAGIEGFINGVQINTGDLSPAERLAKAIREATGPP